MGERIEFSGHGGIDLVADTRGPVGAATVVLLHGGGQTRYSWGGTAVTLAALGYRSITVDARGHGESGWAADADYTLGAFARDVELLLRVVSDDGAVPVHLVGASLGGLTSLLLLGEIAPGIAASLVLVDVVPDFAPAGADRIKDFMVERMHDGFGSLEEVATAIAAYNPHRPPPRDLSGLAKNLRERDGVGTGTGIRGSSAAAATKVVARRPTRSTIVRAWSRRVATSRCRCCSCAAA